MAKALVLSEDTLATRVEPPRAAQAAPPVAPTTPTEPPAAVRPTKPLKAKKAPQVPLQIRISAEDAKAIKRAALEADQTISEFMLSCFHACMKA